MAGMTKAKDALCLKTAKATGTTTSGNITISGIATEDQLVQVLWISDGTAASDDKTDVTSISAADTIVCTETTTAGAVIVMYADASQ